MPDRILLLILRFLPFLFYVFDFAAIPLQQQTSAKGLEQLYESVQKAVGFRTMGFRRYLLYYHANIIMLFF
jgi:hypothetical protein